MRLYHSRSVLFAVLLIATVIAGCGDDPVSPMEEDELDDGPGTVEASGTVEVPPSVDPSTIQIIAGLNEGAISEDGDYEIKLNEDAVQMVSVVNQDQVPILLSLRSIESNAQEEEINPASTAEALIYMHPFFVTSELGASSSLSQAIRELDSFETLAAAIDQRLQQGGFSLATPGDEVEQALAQAFAELSTELEEEYLNKAGKAFQLSPDFPVNGLELTDVQEQNGEISFQVTNARKRWISVYVDESRDGVNFAESGSFADLTPSPDIGIFSLIREGGSSLTAESRTIDVATGDNELIAVRCYGLGVGYPSSEFEINRFLLPSIASGVFDIGIPLFEVVTGINNLDQDLRGRPTEDPFYRLIEETFEDFRGEPSLIDELYRWWRQGDYVKVLVDIVKSVVVTGAENPRLVSDILADKVGESIARSAVDSWLWPIRVGNAAITAANLGWSIGSVLSSEAVTTFTFDVGSVEEGSTMIRGMVRLRTSNGTRGVEGATVTAYDEDDIQIASARTGASGEYTFRSDPRSLRLRITADGYLPVNQYITVEDETSGVYTAPTIYVAEVSRDVGGIRGVVQDATTLDPIDGVDIQLRYGANNPNGEVVQSAVSESGEFEFEDIRAGTYTAYFSKEGYISDFLVTPVSGGERREDYTMNLAPDISTEGGYRIVLTWGEDPRDLDSHLFTPSIEGNEYHVYFANQGNLDRPPYAELDVDDVTSFGPETITIEERYSGTYYYSVYKYAGAGPITASDAEIALYDENGLVRTWNVPTEGTGRWWNVLEIDGATGQVTSVNSISGNPKSIQGQGAKALAIPEK